MGAAHRAIPKPRPGAARRIATSSPGKSVSMRSRARTACGRVLAARPTRTARGRRRGSRFAAALGLAALLGTRPAFAQAGDRGASRDSAARDSTVTQDRPLPADTYSDAGIRGLIERARAGRDARARGLGSFEVTFRERIYAGLSGPVVRRERAMYHQERAARIYWNRDGDRIVRWLGARRGVPIAGIGIEFDEEPRNDDAFDIDFEFLDPADDRVFLGSDWALHPLADTAGFHYRFRSGDTLRIRFPGAERTITMVEAVVEPREARFDLIVGSLWFDRDEALLVRAAYRPATEYDFEREEPEDADEVPGFVKPIRASVDYITVDYGLQELRWWLPNRMAFDGTGSIANFASMPLRFEWTFDEYTIDRPQTIDPGEDALPEGWFRWVEDDEEGEDEEGADEEGADEEEEQPVVAPEAAGDPLPLRATRVIHIVPPVDSLVSSPVLPEPLFSGSVDAFEDEELDQLRDRLGRIEVPRPELPGPHLLAGPLPGLLRYNRVEGISPGARFSWPTGDVTSVEVTGRIGIPEWEPGAEVQFLRRTATGRLGFGVYRRLTDLGDWGRPLGFGNSVNTFLTGYDDGLYFRETGIEVFAGRQGSRTGWGIELFGERHQVAPKTTDVSLPDAWSDRDLPPNLAAERGEVVGLSGRFRAFTGVDPADPVLSGTLWGEAATGDFDYGRIALSTALMVPFPGQWTFATEAATGTVVGSPPVQRMYHLGGPYTLRAFEPGAAPGEAFWHARAELGKGFRVEGDAYGIGGSTFRVIAFGDAAWAGERDAFGTEGWLASAGAGFSILDGLLRIDIAHAVRGGDAWLLHIYSDGLM